MIVFAILIIVNFVVITKGSGRIAEVAARFSLDAMPGKQMAIDADLSAGLIDEKEAKARRKTIEAESNFFGAMDGASKFVRGDAIAGLLIVGINIIGGIIIGVAQKGMAFGDATHTFTLLTVGDGLVSPDAGPDRLHRRRSDGLQGRRRRRHRQGADAPALLLSAGAGHGRRRDGHCRRHARHADSSCSRSLAWAPDALAYYAYQAQGRPRRPGRRRELPMSQPAPKEEPISSALALDLLRIELGYGLLPLINDVAGPPHHRPDQGAAPPVGAGDGLCHARRAHPGQYAAAAPTSTASASRNSSPARANSSPACFLIMDPKGLPIDLPGTATTEPAFGLPATWVTGSLKEEASFRGFTVVDPGTVLTTHLTEVLKSHMAELLSYAETKKLLDDLPPENKKLVEELIPSQISGHRGAARAADPAGRTRFDPRPAGHPGRHRRGGRPYQERALYHRTCPRPPGAPALPRQPVARAATCR